MIDLRSDSRKLSPSLGGTTSKKVLAVGRPSLDGYEHNEMLDAT